MGRLFFKLQAAVEAVFAERKFCLELLLKEALQLDVLARPVTQDVKCALEVAGDVQLCDYRLWHCLFAGNQLLLHDFSSGLDCLQHETDGKRPLLLVHEEVTRAVGAANHVVF